MTFRALGVWSRVSHVMIKLYDALVPRFVRWLRAEVPEGELTDETTVQDLKELLGQGAGKPIRFARWSLGKPSSIHAVRRAAHSSSAWRPYLELARPANVATALADVLAGFAVAGGAHHQHEPLRQLGKIVQDRRQGRP